MIRFLLIVLLSFNVNSNVLEREDIKAFIKFATETSDLTEEEVKSYLVQAGPSKKQRLQDRISLKLRQLGIDIEIDM